jgi:hypothetical protein
MMATAQPNTLGFPVLEPILTQAALDLRAESRFVCRGIVRLELPAGTAKLRGELLDVSAHGFRVSLDQPGLVNGTEVRFSHQFFHGRAKVVWTLQSNERYEAGCMVLRD